MLFLGIDWGEHHHDLCLLDQDGRVLAARQIVDGLAGAGELHALAAAHAQDPAQVAVGIETDRGDAKVLADLVRTDRHNHRPVAGDSPLAEAVKVLARAQQSLIWARQRHVNALRSALREFYPGALTAFGNAAGRTGGAGGAGAGTDAGAGPSAHPRSAAASVGRRGSTAQPAGAGG